MQNYKFLIVDITTSH